MSGGVPVECGEAIPGAPFAVRCDSKRALWGVLTAIQRSRILFLFSAKEWEKEKKKQAMGMQQPENGQADSVVPAPLDRGYSRLSHP